MEGAIYQRKVFLSSTYVLTLSQSACTLEGKGVTCADLPTAHCAPQTPDTPTFSAPLSLQPPARLMGVAHLPGDWEAGSVIQWAAGTLLPEVVYPRLGEGTHSPNLVLPSLCSLKFSLHLYRFFALIINNYLP